jgi:hypothetical protein
MKLSNCESTAQLQLNQKKHFLVLVVIIIFTLNIIYCEYLLDKYLKISKEFLLISYF